MRNKFEGDKIIISIVIVLTGLNKTKNFFLTSSFLKKENIKIRNILRYIFKIKFDILVILF